MSDTEHELAHASLLDASTPTEQEIVDVVDLFEKCPGMYCGVKAAIAAYWTAMVAIFTAALCSLHYEQSSNIVLKVVRDGVTCDRGIPKSWKITMFACLVLFSGLEFQAARQTRMGVAMIRDSKFGLLLALGFGALARYDVFTDIAFAVIADRCGSNIGIWSFAIFGVGVLIAQGVPALWFLMSGQLGTHLGLKSNDLCLFLELIDPCRGELELPSDMESAMTGTSSKYELDKILVAPKVSNTGEESTEESREVIKRSPSQIQEIKQQIQELTDFEASRESEDPDKVKHTALVARAKKLAGAIRFIFEDLLQGILQILFLVEFWETVSWQTMVFTITSVLAGLSVSCGGPLHALWKERENQKYYAQLPKPKDGATWKGVVITEGEFGDIGTWQDWSLFTLRFLNLARRPGQSNMMVEAEARWETLLREFNGESQISADTPVEIRAYLSTYDLVEETIEGKFEPKTSSLDMNTTSQTVLKADPGTEWSFYKYKLKLFPDRLKGSIHEHNDEPYAKITLKPMR